MVQFRRYCVRIEIRNFREVFKCGKIAVLRMGNITNVGTIDYSNLVYSSNNEDIKLYSLEKDDLLFNRTNSSEWVGKTAIYKKEQPAIYAGYLIRIRPILIFQTTLIL